MEEATMNNVNENVFSLNNFECGKNYVLEASAGTGKTYNIIGIVKRLLIDYKIGLDKILIVTYTEKAAGELKNRIRNFINENKDKIQVNADIDNASIGTIHSFCKSVIKEYCISSLEPSSLSLPSDSSLNDFVQEFIRRENIVSDIKMLIKAGLEFKEDDLINKFVKVLNNYYLDENYNENPSIVSYEKSFDDVKNKYLTLLLSNDIEKDLKEVDEELYDDYLLLKNSSKPELNNYAINLKNKEFDKILGVKQMGLFKYNGFTSLEIESAKKINGLKKIIDSLPIDSYIIDKYLKDLYISYQEYKNKNRLQSFNDMIRAVYEKINKEDSPLLECLRKKYQYAIIDEFQDTNELQFQIFSKIFNVENHNIIVVGDPKQSIYAYQGADINVYKKAIDIIAKDKKYKCKLIKNYRSSIGVIKSTNELFKYYSFKDNFSPSLYCSFKEDGKESGVIFNKKYSSSFWINEGELTKKEFAYFAIEQILECTSFNENGETNLRLVDIYNENNIKKTKIRNVDFSDFVVLARSKNEMVEIQNAFKKVGIPSYKYKDNSLFFGNECSSWIALLEAINIPDFVANNRGYFKKALMSKFFSYSLKEISSSYFDEDDSYEYSLFVKWKMLAKERLWQDLFEDILFNSYLQKNMSSLKDMDSLSIFKQISSYCVDYLSNGNNLEELINKLKSLKEHDEEDSPLISKSTDFKAVRIMTMHASKGLEFPVVISVGGCNKSPTASSCYSYHDDNGNRIISLNKNGKYDIEQNEELERLFYVAYTRPKYLLIAPFYDKPGLANIQFHMEKYLKDNNENTFVFNNETIPLFEKRQFKNLHISLLKKKTKEILSRDSKKHDDESLLTRQKDELNKLISINENNKIFMHSYSSLTHNNDNEDKPIFDDNYIVDKEDDNNIIIQNYDLSAKQIDCIYDENVKTISIPLSYPKGSLMGNAIHEVFEKLDFTKYNNYFENVILDRFLYNGFDFSNNEEFLKYTKDVVDNTLNALLPNIKGNKKIDGYFKLSSIENIDKKSEIEFNFNYPNQILKNYLTGYIDLLFKIDDRYCILDWKSDTLNDDFISYSDKNELKNHVDERYSIQRVLYSYCLIKWLKQYLNKDESDIFLNHFGGIYYVFVRGCNKDTSNGIYAQTWGSWEDLQNEFFKIIKKG